MFCLWCFMKPTLDDLGLWYFPITLEMSQNSIRIDIMILCRISWCELAWKVAFMLSRERNYSSNAETPSASCTVRYIFLTTLNDSWFLFRWPRYMKIPENKFCDIFSLVWKHHKPRSSPVGFMKCQTGCFSWTIWYFQKMFFLSWKLTFGNDAG